MWPKYSIWVWKNQHLLKWSLRLYSLSFPNTSCKWYMWSCECLGPMIRTRCSPWHCNGNWCPHKIGNNVYQHKWLRESHLVLSLTMLKIQPFISTLCSYTRTLALIWVSNLKPFGNKGFLNLSQLTLNLKGCWTYYGLTYLLNHDSYSIKSRMLHMYG